MVQRLPHKRFKHQAPSDAALAFADSWGAYLDKDAGGLCPARTWGDTGGAAPHPDMSSMGQAVHDNMRDGSDFFLHGLPAGGNPAIALHRPVHCAGGGS